MVAPRWGKWAWYTACSVVLGMLGVVFACASQPDPAADMSFPSDRLTDVQVESGEGRTVVTLRGLDDPIYTASMHSDPRSLVLDIAAVQMDTLHDLVMVYDGLVENVTASTYGGQDGREALTRIEIALSRDVTYEISSTEQGLRAVIWPAAGEASFSDGDADDYAVTDELPVDGDPWADPQAASVEPAQAPPTSPATTLQSVDVTVTSEGVLLHLEADGLIGALETFTLSDPDRLVIDLPGLTSEVGSTRFDVESSHVARVRIGAHADKVRVVIDGGDEAAAFAERRLSPAGDGLYLAIGTGAELDAALAEALAASDAAAYAAAAIFPEEPAAFSDVDETRLEEQPIEVAVDEFAPEEFAAEDFAPEALAPEDFALEELAAEQPPREAMSRVYGIHYESEDDFERVVILGDTPLDYELLAPDPETLVVSIRDARVAPRAAGRVAALPRRPISLISTFQQPDVEVPEVRVVIKRAKNLEPSVARHGSMLFLDFPNTGLIAAVPPAFPEDVTAAYPTAQQQRMQVLDAEGSGGSMVGDDTFLAAGDDNSDLGESDYPELPMDAPGEYAAAADPGGMELDPGLMVPDMYGDPAIPVSFPAALEPPAAAEILEEGGLIDGKEYEGRRISLDFKDVPVADVLRLIAEVSDLNLIAGDEVMGNVTIRLVDVPWDQALDVILLTKGLGFVRVGNVLRIAPADILKAEEELRLQERRNKETLEDLVVKLQPVNYANVADMAELVKRLLTPRGTVNVDVRTNTLILKDIPSVIDEATALIKAIDTETPQVLIEAKIVEASLDFSRELGSVWAAGTNSLEDGFGGTAPNRGLGGPDFRFHDQNNVIFGNPITSVPTAVFNMSAFVLNEDFNIEVQIQAAESTGDGKVISSPRILTLDNREAEIQQGVSIPFQTFENGDAKLEFIDAVLSLLVTPHVTSDKTIIMQIEVTRNAPDDSVPTPTGSPAIARAEARTETLVKDGQTLVIGGIYTVVESRRESRVPYLHRIPIIGAAFRSREITDQRKELLIFVTPTIVMASELAGG